MFMNCKENWVPSREGSDVSCWLNCLNHVHYIGNIGPPLWLDPGDSVVCNLFHFIVSRYKCVIPKIMYMYYQFSHEGLQKLLEIKGSTQCWQFDGDHHLHSHTCSVLKESPACSTNQLLWFHHKVSSETITCTYDETFNELMKQCQLKTLEHNHSMSNFGLFFFFSSKWAEFLHVVSDLIESHSPVFFSAGLHFIFE